MPIAMQIAARKPNMPIGWMKPMTMVRRLMIPMATPTRRFPSGSVEKIP